MAVVLRAVPVLFVIIWSSGWIVAKVAASHADPLTFLSVRFALAGALLGLACLLLAAPPPANRRDLAMLILTGMLIHGVYLAGVWYAIGQGLPAGISALLAALQPLLATVLAGPLTRERVSPIRWAGLVLGLTGLFIVLEPKLAGIAWHRLDGLALPLLVNALAMVAVTLGTFLQKAQLGQVDLKTLTAWQYLGGLIVTVPLALAVEPLRFDLVPATGLAMAWSVLVLSIVAVALMAFMIRRGSVARVSALIFLIPPTAALQAWAMFGETLTPGQIFGMLTVAFGVYLATRS